MEHLEDLTYLYFKTFPVSYVVSNWKGANNVFFYLTFDIFADPS